MLNLEHSPEMKILHEIKARLDEHENRHGREQSSLHRRQDNCHHKFEKLFEALGDGRAAAAEHRARINGLKGYEKIQDTEIKGLRKLINGWFGGLVFALVLTALVVYFN